MSRALCILPCAGFGTRMSMLPNESKEMLPDPDFEFSGAKHIIDYPLEITRHNKLDTLVVTRSDKIGLKEYIKYHHPSVALQIVLPEGEWPQTVLASKPYWLENNILILPDTRFVFGNGAGINTMLSQLENGCNAVIATHKVDDPDKWGIIKDYTIYEKPKGLMGPQNAWGIIAFKRSYGEELFSGMSNPGGIVLKNTGFVSLNWFQDITRGKK